MGLRFFGSSAMASSDARRVKQLLTHSKLHYTTSETFWRKSSEHHLPGGTPQNPPPAETPKQ